MLLQEWASRAAARSPERTAIVSGQRRLSYGELEKASNRLAGLLGEGGCRPGARVCLLLPKSPEAIVAILGVLKAGAIYVPLDPGSPVSRIARMVRRCRCSWILARGGVTSSLDELIEASGLERPPSIGWLAPAVEEDQAFTPAFTWADLEAYPERIIPASARPGDPAYILFTSGSTGAPKGVAVTHSNVVHFVRWAVEHFGLNGSDRMSAHPPLHFDLSVFDIFGALAAGAELHLVDPQLNLIPHRLAEFVRESELTQWFSVPSVLTFMAKADAVRDGDFPSLRRILWCGEVFPTPALMHWMRRLPSVPFTNLYGPTETTIASSHYTVPTCPERETDPIPIGRACTGEDLMVLDEALSPVPSGEVGDLYIRGAGVSAGYWEDPEKTAAAFVPERGARDPEARMYRTGDLACVGDDGLVYFLGRADAQIKSRGYRIELGEIETALHAVPGLRESAVVAVATDGFQRKTICCAFATLPSGDLDPATIRAALREHLPSYMLPTRWMQLDDLPRNANGKADRREIRELFEESAAPVAT